jgi:putative nucleotidyltransferase with HDIG domain
LLSFNHTKHSAGSIALIPFAAAALVAPSSITLVFVLSAELVAQRASRRPWLKVGFNAAQITLGLAAGILAYRVTGGVPFVALAGVGFLQGFKAAVLPTASLVATVHIINSLCVSAAIAATSDKRLLDVWSQHMKSTLPYSFLYVLVSFYLTWLSINLGIFGTIGMAIPMIAVRQLYKTTLELTSVTEELLDLMVAAIEARDPYTSGHSQRVARASEVIARSIGLSPKDIERVTVAALLHDVGKIDERFAPVLAKEGRLTPEEWRIMKEHPIRGAELVGLLSSLQDIVKPVRHHHENWDGTGYPDGIKGENIPLASRIIMFADTLDAMTTDRPYRKALTVNEARAEFIKFRGKQFDPIICDRILSSAVWDELYVATDKSAEKERLLTPVRRSSAS